MPEWLPTLLVAIVGSFSFAVLFRTPSRYLLHTMAVGTLAAMSAQLRPGAFNVGITVVVTACFQHHLSIKNPAMSGFLHT